MASDLGLGRIDADRRDDIARQVRCSTGATYSPAPRVAVRPDAAPRGAVAAVVPDAPGAAARLLAWLNGLPEGAVLPGVLEIADAIGAVGDADSRRQAVSRAFSRLRDYGAIEQQSGSGYYSGERAVLLVESGRVLCTEGAPANWVDVLNRRVG